MSGNVIGEKIYKEREETVNAKEGNGKLKRKL
jgi:hypothetical protein